MGTLCLCRADRRLYPLVLSLSFFFLQTREAAITTMAAGSGRTERERGCAHQEPSERTRYLPGSRLSLREAGPHEAIVDLRDVK